MSPNKTKYDLTIIKELLSQAESDGLGFTAKWEFIGDYFGVKADTARKWFQRNREKTEPPKLKEANGRMSSDQLRAAYFILTGKTSRHRIQEVKALLARMLTED
jgi:hypothetical protein